MIKEVLYGLIILAGFPIGIVLSLICKEELQAWKRRFTYIVVTSLILIPIVYIIDFEYKIPILITLIFIIIIFMTITYKTEYTNIEKKHLYTKVN